MLVSPLSSCENSVSYALISALNLYRVLGAYVWLSAEISPAIYLGNMERWDTIAHDALNAFTTWVGDCLVVSQSLW
jgi:hypothetical protein